MVRYLIAEDEDLEKSYLEKNLKRILGPVDEVQSVSNGAEALEAFALSPFDVLLTDITMPVLGGLELLEQIRKKYPKTVCYILTSYDYFSYAQKAIQLDVEDFILKPVSRTSLQQIADKTHILIAHRKQIEAQNGRIHALESRIEKDCFYAIAHHESIQQLNEHLQILGLSGQEDCLCFETVSQEEAERIAREFRSLNARTLTGSIDGRWRGYVFSEESFDLEKTAAIEDDADIQCRFSVIFDGLSDLIQSEQTTRREDDQRQWTNAENLLIDDLLYATADHLVRSALLDGGIPSRLLDQLREIETGLHCPILPDRFPRQIDKVLQFQYGCDLQLHLEPNEDLEKYTEEALQQIRRYQQITSTQRDRFQYHMAMEWIRQHCSEMISLRDAADSVHLSPYTLSKLINQFSACSFSEIVHACRLRKARNLIRAGMSFKPTAWSAGYSSQSYFSKNFKRLTGISPSEYKETADLLSSRYQISYALFSDRC